MNRVMRNIYNVSWSQLVISSLNKGMLIRGILGRSYGLDRYQPHNYQYRHRGWGARGRRKSQKEKEAELQEPCGKTEEFKSHATVEKITDQKRLENIYRLAYD